MSTIFYFAVSFLAGMITIPFLMKLSKKTNFLVDVPKGDVLKIHKKSIPLLGGLAMAISALVGFLFVLEKNTILQIGAVIIGFLIMFFLGFYDDLKWKHISTIKPMLKFTLLIVFTFIPSVILSFAGISFNFFPMPVISILLSFIYIFVVINAVNYQDGMDGLAGGLVFISLIGFLYLGFISGAVLTVAISLIFLGAVLAFLRFNFPPAKVFMGDSGAYSLGFILTVLALLFSKPYNIYSVLAPIFIIGLPIFDGIFTNIRRIANGKSIFLGDRSHVYDKLLSRFNRGSSMPTSSSILDKIGTKSGQKGFSTKKTLAICCGLQAISATFGVLLTIIS